MKRNLLSVKGTKSGGGGGAGIIYLQVISYSNVNNEEDDTQSLSEKGVECNKTCFLSQCIK